MSDFSVPLNRVGVVRLRPLDVKGDVTLNQMGVIYWNLGVGSDAYFNLVVSADGLSAEIHPVDEGSGSFHVEMSSIGEATVTVTRTVEITANASDPGVSGEYPRFIGVDVEVVHSVGSLI